MTGFVSFVSSGPGDPDLLTVAAVDRLQKAEVVLFDDLSAGPILEHAQADADLIGVGKRAGRASPKQDHVSRVLVDHAKAGLRVVRLKSGDSGMFGRLEEELTALRAEHIPFEIIPGVTSASAAAATAGIPLTRRLTARRVQFITGADVTGDLPPDVNMAALADPLATTVVYMGKRTFPGLAMRLIEHGLPADTPAMLAEAVSTPAEKVTRFTIQTLAAHLADTTSSTPALIFYGALADDQP
ncbi:uroporphyrinogen-III C-methyltransferase [Sulfitobacter aestuariivivens]|uniref:uroporphyrinogen-III C-methyltransferase n=1 Tax=Sulfitobacter aestuariivivens TaxID=2766981 RepID=A0A927D8I7_9RHOB|nr:uroporphyrinogen-III C-methyltransferase [Sulfitobacter aestuariivivens]MBD3665552.1 uroporphyrinogen-III C-methyltransferase [Sulfitobacter aestuariivivens]